MQTTTMKPNQFGSRKARKKELINTMLMSMNIMVRGGRGREEQRTIVKIAAVMANLC